MMATSAVTSNLFNRGTLSARRDDVFYSAMALLILGTVLLGFARSYYFAGMFAARLPSLVVHLHAAVFSLWILLFIAQTMLISAGRVDWHRRAGMFGAALAASMVILGLMVATDSLARGFVPPGLKLDPRSFYSTPFFSTVVFCILITWALRARSNGPAHKRLILIATISLLGAPVGRWPAPIFRGPVVAAVLALYVVFVAGFDLWSQKQVHPATLKGGLFMIIAHQMMFPIGLTPVWRHFATDMLRAWNSIG
jgi:uncharacterized membrane protein YozB (DUF420 family)